MRLAQGHLLGEKQGLDGKAGALVPRPCSQALVVVLTGEGRHKKGHLTELPRDSGCKALALSVEWGCPAQHMSADPLVLSLLHF